MTTIIRSIALCAILCVSALLSSAQGDDGARDELPHYKLRVGQKLTYRCEHPPYESDEGEGGKYSSRTTHTWTACVICQNSDGGWKIVFVQSIERKVHFRGVDSTEGLAFNGHFDLMPDGRMVENRTFRPMADPTVIFPPLPRNGAEIKSNWTATTTIDDADRTFTMETPKQSADDRTFVFKENVKTLIDSINLVQTRRQYEFDRLGGIVRKVISTSDHGPPKGEESRSTTTIELVSNDQLKSDKLAAFADDAEKLAVMSEKYELLYEKANHDFEHSAALMEEAERLLHETERQLTTPDVLAMLQEISKTNSYRAKFILQAADEHGPFIGKASPEWKTVDLAGKPHALADYRGKVVVLDFWYRSCYWCIRAMPQMKQLANDFNGQDVAILGINSDEKNEDAQFVIDTLELNYPTLKNSSGDERINAKYYVHGWPTLVIIDREGVVRRYHSDYSKTLRDDVGTVIRELLMEKKP